LASGTHSRDGSGSSEASTSDFPQEIALSDLFQRIEDHLNAEAAVAASIAHNAGPKGLAELLLQSLRSCQHEEAARLKLALLAASREDDNPEVLARLFAAAREFAHAGKAFEASCLADVAAALLDQYNVLDRLDNMVVLHGLLTDAQSGDGRWTLKLLGNLAHRGAGSEFPLLLVDALGGTRPALGSRARMALLADQAREVLRTGTDDSALRDGAFLMLLVAQDYDSLAKPSSMIPDGAAFEIPADARDRVLTRRRLQEAALRAPATLTHAGNDKPPFIVVHRGAQDYVALCAASLALSNGRGNVVLIGDDSTATLDAGRYVPLANYFQSADSLAPDFVHHSVNEPNYTLFSFQRWLVVEEFCRRNNIDQCVIMDSDTLAYSSAAEIIDNMPCGYEMNNWTWTTTIRSTRALSELADFIRNFYARPPKEVLTDSERYGRRVERRDARSFQDMHMFHLFRRMNPSVMLNQYDIEHHGGLDQAAGLSNGLEVGIPNDLVRSLPGRPLKRPYIDGGCLHFRDAVAGNLVRFRTVHCQGPSKAALHHYAALLLPGGKSRAATWRGAPSV